MMENRSIDKLMNDEVPTKLETVFHGDFHQEYTMPVYWVRAKDGKTPPYWKDGDA